MRLPRHSRIIVVALVCAFAFESAALAQTFGHGKLSNPEGFRQLTLPATADLKAFYGTGDHGEHSNGRLLLSTFPASAGNIVGVV